MKKLIIAAIASMLLAGCCYNPDTPKYYDNSSTNIIMQTEFNEENYVWESFIFSTNRVDNIGK